jgi:hypothetical protein
LKSNSILRDESVEEARLLSKDITAVLAGWDFEPDEMQVRIVTGDDGRDKIQMRIDLGLIQMEINGRPDGQRPGGFESALDLHEARAAGKHGGEFDLSPADCAELMREGVQFYHRYRAAFHLQRYDLVARDTERNLRLFAFVVRHATREADKVQFDQYRPYVTMMHARAQAHLALARNDHRAALAQVDEGIEAIRSFLREYDQEEHEAECLELGFLLRWRRDVESDRPMGPVERLERQLEKAVSLENYEEAARIRDQLHRLRGDRLTQEPTPEISGGLP